MTGMQIFALGSESDISPTFTGHINSGKNVSLGLTIFIR